MGFDLFFFHYPAFIRCNLTSVVLYITVKHDWKYILRAVSVEYERPAVGQNYYVSFPVPDGQNLVSSHWLNACPCGERVSECFYSIYAYGEMERLQMDGNGLNKC